MPERELILEYLDLVDDVLDELDSREEVESRPLDPRCTAPAPTASCGVAIRRQSRRVTYMSRKRVRSAVHGWNANPRTELLSTT